MVAGGDTAMTYLVPFDGSPLSATALLRAASFGEALGEPVVAATVIKADNARYAREMGWLGEGEPFDLERIAGRLREEVATLVPDADFRHEVVDKRAPPGTVSSRLRKVAAELDASLVAMGSDNAGHVAVSLSSVGGSLASGDGYDVLIVRRADEARLAEARGGAGGEGAGPE